MTWFFSEATFYVQRERDRVQVPKLAEIKTIILQTSAFELYIRVFLTPRLYWNTPDVSACTFYLYTTIRKQFHLKSSLIYKNNPKTKLFNSVKGYHLAKVYISQAHAILRGKIVISLTRNKKALHILNSCFKCTIDCLFFM